MGERQTVKFLMSASSFLSLVRARSVISNYFEKRKRK